MDSMSRRDFARVSLALGAALGMGSASSLARAAGSLAPDAASSGSAPARKMNLLILGGTGFSGPKMAEYAKARGHTVTLFNRGRTERRIGIIEDVEKLYGNRDPDKVADETDPASPKGLTQLQGRKFDAIIDTSGFYPRHVRTSAELLRESGFYLFISTISVYKDNDSPADETAPVGTVEDTVSENQGAQGERYGPLKALCEQEVQKVFVDRSAIVRPGFIVGPGDPTDRFTYWPVRAGEGGDFLCPGDGTDPVQFIDNRDLAEWCVRLCESRTSGVFNATGPNRTLPFKELVDACVAAGGGKATPVWVPIEFLAAQQVAIGGELPIFLPGGGETAGFHRRSVSRAAAAGLTYRSVAQTCKDTLEWWPREVERRERVGKQLVEEAKKAGRPVPTLPPSDRLRVGMTRERAAEIIAAFRAQKK